MYVLLTSGSRGLKSLGRLRLRDTDYMLKVLVAFPFVFFGGRQPRSAVFFQQSADPCLQGLGRAERHDFFGGWQACKPFQHVGHSLKTRLRCRIQLP